MTFLAAAVGPLAAPLLRAYVPPEALEAESVGLETAVVHAEAIKRNAAPSGWLHLRRGPLPLHPEAKFRDASEAETSQKKKKGPATEALFPRHALMTELLPWVGKHKADTLAESLWRSV